VTVLDNTEWLTWLRKVDQAGYVKGFAGRRVDDALTLGADIDAVSSATFTSRGIVDGVKSFWCLHFCPVGYTVDFLASWRRRLAKLFLGWPRKEGALAAMDASDEAEAEATGVSGAAGINRSVTVVR